MALKIALFFGIIFSAIECKPVDKRRDAFDPEQLMIHYMNMRTNQGLFGSYHPNDLVNSIVEYFNHGGPRTINDNQWGLAVYNPNDKIGQYIGKMESPGNLGPGSMENANDETNINSSGESVFNPNALNEKLLQSALNKGNQFSSFISPSAQGMASGQTNLGFNADTLKGQIMDGAMNHPDTAAETTSTATVTVANNRMENNAGQELAEQVLGFNADTLNARLLNSLSTYGNTNGGSSEGNSNQGHNRAVMHGFNPDTLNAGLFSSIQYDPNSVGKMPTYNGKAAAYGEMVKGAAPKGSHDLDGSIGLNNPSGFPVTHGVTSVNGEIKGNQYGGNPDRHSSVIEDRSDKSLEHNAKTDHDYKTGIYNVSQSGNFSASGGIIGMFTAQETGDQMPVVPPGVPAGTDLHQTDPTTAKVNGIGGMG